MILGTKYYKLSEAVEAGQTRTKGTSNTLYVYPQPSINGLFVDWILSGIKYSNIRPIVIIERGNDVYPKQKEQ